MIRDINSPFSKPLVVPTVGHCVVVYSKPFNFEPESDRTQFLATDLTPYAEAFGVHPGTFNSAFMSAQIGTPFEPKYNYFFRDRPSADAINLLIGKAEYPFTL
jgi:hypothetical protein